MDDSSAFSHVPPNYTLYQKNGYYLTSDSLYPYSERYMSPGQASSSSGTTMASSSGSRSSETASYQHFPPTRLQYLQCSSHSPPQQPAAHSPHRVSRKPVASASPVAAQPLLYHKQLQQQQQPVRNKNYAAADTIHPKRMHKQPVSSPPLMTAATATSSFLTDVERKATRRNRYHSTIVPMHTDSICSKALEPATQQKTPAKAEAEEDMEAILPTLNYGQRHSIFQVLPATINPSPTISKNAPPTAIVDKASTNFWNPRTTDIHHQSLEPMKKSITDKIRGLLQPHRTQIEIKASNDQYQRLYQESLQKCQTPLPSTMRSNPFDMIYCQEAFDSLPQVDFSSVDQYASTIQDNGVLITPSLLSRKFLVRPYPHSDVFKLRSIFMWIVQHLRPEYHHKRHDLVLLRKQEELLSQQHNECLERREKTSADSDNGQYRKKKKKLLQKLIDTTSSESHQESSEHASRINNHFQSHRLDAMHLLKEEHLSFLSPVTYSADEVEFEEEEQKMVDHAMITSRLCKSAFDMAHLFCTMALAAGLQEVHVVCGYLKGPTDTANFTKKSKLLINHAWCSVKVEEEYRFIDCWLASPFHPHNNNQTETHWFLTKPSDMILTHFPKEPHEQHLQMPLSPPAFVRLPYVRTSFFEHSVHITDMETGLRDDDDSSKGISDRIYSSHVSTEYHHHTHLLFVRLQLLRPESRCYAEVECQDGQTYTRCLTQYSANTGNSGEGTICDIKAVLPAHHRKGWLKVYMASIADMRESENTPLQKQNYLLTMCIPVYQRQQQQHQSDHAISSAPLFEFVQLYHLPLTHVNRGYYIQGPQCYHLYPLQTYQFSIRANHSMSSTISNTSKRLHSYQQQHHKLALKSPSGKLRKLMYYPQDQTYDEKVTISEAGKWTLVCFISANHHDRANGTSYVIAQWVCSN